GFFEGKIRYNGIFAPVSPGALPRTPPPERSIASGSRCLRLQGDSPTWSGTTSHSGCGVYSLACLPLAAVFSFLLYICAVYSRIVPGTFLPAMLSGGCSHGASCGHLCTPGSEPHSALSRDALVGFQGRGFADVVQPNCWHSFLLEALLFQWPLIR